MKGEKIRSLRLVHARPASIVIGPVAVAILAEKESGMRYRMSDGTIIDTTRIRHVWGERRDDGFGRSSGSKWGFQQLCESLKGRYYLWYYSNWQGSRDNLEWVSPQEATRWLILNEYDLPAELQQHEKPSAIDP